MLQIFKQGVLIFLRILNLIFKNRIKHKIDKNLDVLEMGRNLQNNYENEFQKNF